VFEAVLKRFQRVSAGGGVSLEKKDNSPKTVQYGLKDGETTKHTKGKQDTPVLLTKH